MKATLKHVGAVEDPQGKTRETSEEEEGIEGYEMLIGEGMESEAARNNWIDEVEKLLEFQSLERGQQHRRKNFDNPSVHNDRKYLERK